MQGDDEHNPLDTVSTQPLEELKSANKALDRASAVVADTMLARTLAAAPAGNLRIFRHGPLAALGQCVAFFAVAFVVCAAARKLVPYNKGRWFCLRSFSQFRQKVGVT